VILLVGAVVDFDPAGVGFERWDRGTDSRLVPAAAAGSYQVLMMAPGGEVSRGGEPDVSGLE